WWHGRGVVRCHHGTDLAEQYVGLVVVVALIVEGLGGEGDGDGDRNLLRRQIRLHGGTAGEQRILHQPVAGGDDPKAIGVALVLIGAGGTARLGVRLAAQRGRHHFLVRVRREQLARAHADGGGLQVVDVGRLNGAAGYGPRRIPVRGFF